METDELIGMDLGHYRVIDRLGEGGMAVVYRAQDFHLDRFVAIKVLRLYQMGISSDTRGFIKRFEREAHMLAHLQHPNIVPIIDFGSAQNRYPYLVMPLLSGGTLKDKTGRVMPFQQAAHLLAPVAGALAYAHNAGIIHRDIKPTNILLTESNEPMLTDFGIARFIQQESVSLTGTGAFIGTPGYMAPEQWKGQAGPQTDIFSLGVAFYELVTGHNPYNADTPQEVMYRQLMEPLPDPREYTSSLPQPVVEMLLRALAKDPKDRYQRMEDVADLLLRFSSPNRSALDSTLTGSQAPVLPETRVEKVSSIPTETVVEIDEQKATQTETLATAYEGERSSQQRPTLEEQPASGDRQTLLEKKQGVAAGMQTAVDSSFAHPARETAKPLPDSKEEPPASHLWNKLAWPVGAAVLLVLVGAAAWMILGGNLFHQAALAPTELVTKETAILATSARAGSPTAARDRNTKVVPSETAPAIPIVPPTAAPLPSDTPRPVKNTVWWDSSHGPHEGHEDGYYDPTQFFSKLVTLLTGNGINVQTNRDVSLTSLNLLSYGAVVINEWSAENKPPYTNAEVDKLVQYVSQGGSLLIMGDNPKTHKYVSVIAEQFGVSVGQEPSVETADQFQQHIITQGISSLKFEYKGGTLKAADASQVVGFADGNPVVVAIDHLPGRVVVIGDADLFSNLYLQEADNSTFAVNVFRWLTGLSGKP